MPAARLTDDVPTEEKKRRLAELMAVQDEIWAGLAGAQVGQVWNGVVEERGPAAGRRLAAADGQQPQGRDRWQCG